MYIYWHLGCNDDDACWFYHHFYHHSAIPAITVVTGTLTLLSFPTWCCQAQLLVAKGYKTSQSWGGCLHHHDQTVHFTRHGKWWEADAERMEADQTPWRALAQPADHLGHSFGPRGSCKGHISCHPRLCLKAQWDRESQKGKHREHTGKGHRAQGGVRKML